jgi:hypothetical protein
VAHSRKACQQAAHIIGEPLYAVANTGLEKLDLGNAELACSVPDPEPRTVLPEGSPALGERGGGCVHLRSPEEGERAAAAGRATGQPVSGWGRTAKGLL